MEHKILMDLFLFKNKIEKSSTCNAAISFLLASFGSLNQFKLECVIE